MIDQACGIVIALATCPPQEAFEALVEVFQHSNTKLRTVAARVTATTSGHALPEPVRAALTPTLRTGNCSNG